MYKDLNFVKARLDSAVTAQPGYVDCYFCLTAIDDGTVIEFPGPRGKLHYSVVCDTCYDQVSNEVKRLNPSKGKVRLYPYNMEWNPEPPKPAQLLDFLDQITLT